MEKTMQKLQHIGSIKDIVCNKVCSVVLGSEDNKMQLD